MPAKNALQHTLQHIKTNLITGFLGVGKTSSILHLMAQKPVGERWSVLVNEFGNIGIDGAIYEASEASRATETTYEEKGIAVKEIPGGCMCCAAGVSLQVAVNQILKATKPQRLLIEPSGLGHPKRVLDILRGEYFQGVLDMRPTICLIDPNNLLDTRYSTHENFIDQIAMADVLVANKMDNCDINTEKYFDDYVSSLEPPKLDIIKTRFGRLDLSVLDGIANTKCAATYPDHHNHLHEINDSSIIDGYESTGYIFPKETIFDYDKLIVLFEQWKVERIKAVLQTDKGWKIFNIHNQQLAIIDINESRDNRIEVIRCVEDTRSSKNAKELEALIKSCFL